MPIFKKFKKVNLKPVLNKSNGQVSLCLPKRKFSKKQFEEILKSKKLPVLFPILDPKLKGGLK